MTKKKKPLSLAKKVLFELTKGAGEFYESGARTYRPFRYPKTPYTKEEEKLFYRRVKYLERQKLIKLRTEGDKIFYKITEAGQLEGLKVAIIECDKELSPGQVCIIVFDIPESIRKVRQAIRTFLKTAGFYQVQKSVWESNKDVAFELQKLMEALKVDKYIEIYQGLPLRRR